MGRVIAIAVFALGCEDPAPAPAATYDLAREPAYAEVPAAPIACPPGTTATGDVPGATDERVSVAGVNRRIWCARPDGVNHGPSLTWDSDGNLLTSANFADGVLHGVRTERDADGQKRREETHYRGARHGPWRVWDEEGNLTLDCTYAEDVLHGPYVATGLTEPVLLATFRGDSVTRVRGRFERGEIHGVWEVWTAARVEKSHWSQGVRHGPYERWHDNGQPAAVGEFVHGQRHGRWRAWTMDGLLLEDGSYREGFKHGRWRERSAAGLESGRYENGRRVGAWAEGAGDTILEQMLREKVGDFPLHLLR